MADRTAVDPDSILRPVTADPVLPFDETDPTRMATIDPTTRPDTEVEPTVVTPSSAPAPTTPSPSPSPTPSTTPSPVAPTTSSAAPTTSAAPSPSETESEEPETTSTAPTSTSTSTATSTTPTSTSTSTTPSSTSETTSTSTTSSSSSSSSRPVETVTSTVSQSRPGLVTSFSSVSRTSSVSGAAASSTGKGGVGGSGLPVGGLVGIIIGAIVVLCLVALVVTRTIRKKARNRRTAHRTSMFEPWPAPVTMEDEDDLEKSRYSPPSQAYPMQNTGPGTYDYETYDVYGQAGVGAGGAAAAGVAAATYPPNNNADYQYPQQDYGYSSNQGHDYPQQDPGMPPVIAGAAASSMGLRDGMMARVQVGFNRTLEDELAIAPGQQLWLHTVYDDGWAMCEDQNQHRGVVPVTSLVPWTDDDPNHLSTGMTRSHTGESLSGTSQRRSSLYANAQAGNNYLNQPQ